MFNSLKSYNFSGKRVLVRCDFNVPIENNKISDSFRIEQSIATLNFLKDKGAKIILISHLSKLKNNKKQSLKPVISKLEELLKRKVDFFKDCIGRNAEKKSKNLKDKDILLLENLRNEKGEEENDENFVKSLAALGDVYVNEAFSVCHREHASVVGLPRILPHFAGFNLEKEVEGLTRLFQNYQSPFIVIIGGAKVFSKIKVIESFLDKADHLLFGGKIANVILQAKGICISNSCPDEEIIKKLQDFNLTNTKIHLPVDVLASDNKNGENYIREIGPASVKDGEDIFDIGKDTIKSFGEIIKTAKTLLWSGPVGFFENQKFETGTKEIARAISENDSAFKVIGGGDTIAAIRKFGVFDKISYVSSGGGAMLQFLAGEKLPGIEALKK